MTDVAYLCHNCGSLHEVESVRENLILDRRTAGSYELPGQSGLLHPRARFLRWRRSRGLARALWPGYLDRRPLGWGRRRVPATPEPVPARPVRCRAATGGSERNLQSLHPAHRAGDSARPAARQPASRRVFRAAAAIHPAVVRTPPKTREGITPSVRRPRLATRGAHAPSARAPRSKGSSGLARLVLTLLVSHWPLRRAIRIQPGSAFRYK